MKLEAGKEMDRCCVLGWLNEVYRHPTVAFNTYSDEQQIEFAHDALVLLKEQEAKTQGADSGMCEICSFYERAMSVKPHYNARTNWYECGACRYSMTSGMHCRSELIPAYKVGFCAKCGKAVQWE